MDCSKEIRDYHDKRVKLSEETRKMLKKHAETNEKRLKDGLKRSFGPAPCFFVSQGSYAMRTTVQHQENDYDIDYGVVFTKESLVGKNGGEKSSLDARKMVLEAMSDDSFKKEPKINDNCVRVFYNEGHHVDIPVYRTESSNGDSTLYELASTNWKKSNPEAVTEWFQGQLKEKHSSNESDGEHQMRRLVRLIKKYANSRKSWNMPSGFILTVLVNEQYSNYIVGDDLAFYQIIKRIKLRLDKSFIVRHPVLLETITKTKEDANMKELRDRLEWAISVLKTTENTYSKNEALQAWNQIFNTNFFDTETKESDGTSTFVITGRNPTQPVHKEGGGRFG